MTAGALPAGEEIASLLNRLEAAPEKFAYALERLEAADSFFVSGTDSWSAAEVFAHVRASNDIMEHRIYAVLARDNPTLPAYDDRQWAQVAHYTSLPLVDSVSTMRARRNELVRMLRAAPPEAWLREGLHETAGAITLLQIVRKIIDHDEEHISQIAAM